MRDSGIDNRGLSPSTDEDYREKVNIVERVTVPQRRDVLDITYRGNTGILHGKGVI